MSFGLWRLDYTQEPHLDERNLRTVLIRNLRRLTRHVCGRTQQWQPCVVGPLRICFMGAVFPKTDGFSEQKKPSNNKKKLLGWRGPKNRDFKRQKWVTSTKRKGDVHMYQPIVPMLHVFGSKKWMFPKPENWIWFPAIFWGRNQELWQRSHSSRVPGRASKGR